MDHIHTITAEINARLDYVPQPQPVVDEPVLYRVLHDFELPGGVRQIVKDRGVPLPEVHSLLPNQFTPLNYSWQWLWYKMNRNMSPLEWRKLASCHRAFTNNFGYDCSEGKHGPFADFVNGKDIGAEKPKIEALVCGGAVLRGAETTYKGEPHLRVDVMDGTKPPPSEWDKEWLYYEAVSVRPDGGVQSFSITPHPEYVPLVASILPVYVPMWKVKRVER